MKIFITINKFIAIILLLSINSVISYGQQISVMHFAGDAYTYNTDDSKVKYNKIVFGPLPNADKILVKENATQKTCPNCSRPGKSPDTVNPWYH